MTKAERLQALYDKLPKVNCKQLCSEACGPVPLTKLELKRLGTPPRRSLLSALGSELNLECKFLDGKLCSVYTVRPLVCRLFGAAEGLMCKWGCKPERVISRVEAAALFKEIQEIGGRSVFMDGSEFGGVSPMRKP